MMAKIRWTAKMDAVIIDGRASRLTFDDLASVLGIGRSAVAQRARDIGAHNGTPMRPVFGPPKPVPEIREPLPPGHPETWQAINAGLCIEGCVYEPPKPIIGRKRA